MPAGRRFRTEALRPPTSASVTSLPNTHEKPNRSPGEAPLGHGTYNRSTTVKAPKQHPRKERNDDVGIIW
jgi:hypothetical protein